MNKRFYLSIILLVLIMAAPFWLYLPAIMLASVFIPFYWEGLVFAFVIDSLYGSRSHELVNFHYPYALFILIVISLSFIIRQRLRLHA